MKTAFLIVVAAIVAGVAALFVDLSLRLDRLESAALEDLSAASERLTNLEALADMRHIDAKSGAVGEKIVQLPQDQGKWHLSIWYQSRDDAASRRLAIFFADDPILQQVAKQTHVHEHYAATPDPIFRERYAAEQAPGVLVQNGKGEVLYKATGANVPSSGAALAQEILESIGVQAQDCPDGICPPASEQLRRPIPDRRPNRRDTNKPTELQFVALGAIVVLIAGVVAYLLTQPQMTRPNT